MFEAISEWEDILRLLELKTILAEHDEPATPAILNDEDYWDQAYTTFAELCSEEIYLENFDNTLYLFRFPELHEFYTLCKELSRREGIGFRKYPAVKKAENYIRNTLAYVNDYTFSWNLWVPKKLVKKRAYTFLIETSCEFSDYSGIIDAVLTIQEYYAERCDRLRKEMQEDKILEMPQRKEQKAA
ncbi:MAG: hypothetical protein IJT66_03745 [Clostridia bacterium]|nr:hypothetical protein [Clostridia bacterium]